MIPPMSSHFQDLEMKARAFSIKEKAALARLLSEELGVYIVTVESCYGVIWNQDELVSSFVTQLSQWPVKRISDFEFRIADLKNKYELRSNELREKFRAGMAVMSS